MQKLTGQGMFNVEQGWKKLFTKCNRKYEAGHFMGPCPRS